MRTSFIPPIGKALLVVLLAALLLLPLWVVRYPPLLDYPDHLARAFILVHLKDPSYRFGNFYSTEWGPYPYLGMDLSLIALQKLMAARAAGRVLLSISVIAVPIAGWWFLRQANPGHDALALWTLLLSYDPFFLDGFVNFQLGLAICFFALGFWLRYLEKPTLLRFLTALGLATCGYFTHLIAFGITEFIVLAYSLARRLNLRQILWSAGLFLPGVLMFFLSHISSYNGEGTQFRSLPQKFFAAGSELLHSYSPRLELVTVGAIVVCIFAARLGNAEFRWNGVWLTVFAATVGLYLALPNEVGDTWLIDVRVIPPLFVLLLGVARLGRRQRALALLAVVVFGLRTVDIVRGFLSQQSALWNMEQAIQMLPRNSRLLPIVNVDVVKDDLLHQFYAHFWAYAIIERGVSAPYLFDLRGQTPLRIKKVGYIPDDPETQVPNWKEVCNNYDYLWAYDTDYYNGYLYALGTEVYRSGRLRLYRLHQSARGTQ